MTRAMAVLIVAGFCLPAPAAPAQEAGETVAAAPAAETRETLDLQALLERVSGSSGKEFLVDARVPSRIYVGGTDVDDPSYPVLLSILRNNGLAAAEIEGYVNILPDAGIRQLPLRIVQRDDAEIPDDEWVTRVIAVPGVDATWLVPILRPLLPQAGHLAALPNQDPRGQSNKLLIVDSYANVRRITEVVRLLTE